MQALRAKFSTGGISRVPQSSRSGNQAKKTSIYPYDYFISKNNTLQSLLTATRFTTEQIGVATRLGGRIGKTLNPEVMGSSPTDAVSNLGQVRLPHVALVSKGRF